MSGLSFTPFAALQAAQPTAVLQQVVEAQKSSPATTTMNMGQVARRLDRMEAIRIQNAGKDLLVFVRESRSARWKRGVLLDTETVGMRFRVRTPTGVIDVDPDSREARVLGPAEMESLRLREDIAYLGKRLQEVRQRLMTIDARFVEGTTRRAALLPKGVQS